MEDVVAAIIGLVDVLVITIGVYAVFGFEISPAAVIGFLTILSYALYDTTVVFDKVRENTREDGEISGRTFAESVNLAANQTLIRSINTTVVAILPVGAILFIGVPLGARTLSDISLSIFVGTIVAAYSTLFVAVPMYALLREKRSRSPSAMRASSPLERKRASRLSREPGESGSHPTGEAPTTVGASPVGA